ncbi:MAG: 3-dehydroquinate synthase [Alphaproteobacteria bacterium]|nr:3-dehydroquinate synthase [Alphaproteobacteria bacterium]
MNEEKLSVALGARSYDIIIGARVLDGAGKLLAPLLARAKAIVVTDENVKAAQGPRLEKALADAGIEQDWITLPPGEATKTFDTLRMLVSRLAALGVDRSDMIIAFGGGVVGDITGFAAAILRRGCRFAQIPTSLLAQVDSAVGGKTAINIPEGKNLVGAFHQPSIVIADVETLSSLPARELRAGYAEIVKYGALGDAPFFAWLEANGRAVLEGDVGARIKAVRRACEIKAAIVAEDEREDGRRALLNLGHTFGHALEAALGYSAKLLHGEAVAAGMGLAFDFSAERAGCPRADAARLKAHLKAAGLPADLADIPYKDVLDPDRLLAFMRQDKKVRAGAMTLILARRLGEAFVARDAREDVILAFLKEEAASAAAGE